MRSIPFYRLLMLLPVLLLVSACSAASAAPGTPTNALGPLGPAPTAIPTSPVTRMAPGSAPALPAGVGGRFVFAPGDGSIWVYDSPTAAARVLVKATASVFAEAPALSPDGAHVVFRQMTITAQTGPADITIQMIDFDGKNQHAVVHPPDATSDLVYPTFSPDGQWIYYTIDAANHQHSEIRRIKVTGGDSVKVADDGREVTVSPDGKQIAFVRVNTQRFTDWLVVADANGQNVQTILRDDTFQSIEGPRFSPDGRSILFAGSGPPTHELRASVQPSDCQPWLLCALAAPASAHGLPWDLWTMSPDGSQAKQLTKMGGDSPWPAWSKDGKYIAFFQADGIYLLEVGSGRVTQVSRSGGYGTFDWWSGQ